MLSSIVRDEHVSTALCIPRFYIHPLNFVATLRFQASSRLAIGFVIHATSAEYVAVVLISEEMCWQIYGLSRALCFKVLLLVLCIEKLEYRCS